MACCRAVGRGSRECCQAGGLDTIALLGRLGFVVTTAPVLYMGIILTDDGNTIGDTFDAAPAGICGLASGDVITTINGYAYDRKTLIWATGHDTSVTLGILRGHERLDFILTPTTHEAVTGMIWSGDAAQRSLISKWFAQPFEVADGQAIAMDFYKNFHRVETLV